MSDLIDSPSITLLYLTNAGFAFSAAALLYVLRAQVARALGGVLGAGKSDEKGNVEASAASSSSGGQLKPHEPMLIGVTAGFATLSILGIIGVNPWAAITFALIAGIWTPQHVRRKRLDTWQREFDLSLVESLTTVSSSLRAGLTLKDSLGVAARNCAPVFAGEAANALKEYRFGRPIEEALDNIRKRVRTQNANITFGAMILGSQLGGNLPATLQKIVRTIRERDRVEGKLRALTAQGRTQAILLCSAPPAIGVCMFLWDPGKMSLLTDTFPGQALLCLAIVLEVVGIAVTKRIMKLEV